MGSSAAAGVTSLVGIQLLRLGFSRAELAEPTELVLGLGLVPGETAGKGKEGEDLGRCPLWKEGTNTVRRLREELHLSLAFGLDSF